MRTQGSLCIAYIMDLYIHRSMAYIMDLYIHRSMAYIAYWWVTSLKNKTNKKHENLTGLESFDCGFE